MQTQLKRSAHHTYGIDISIHPRFIQNGSLYSHDRGSRSYGPLTEIGTNGRVNDAIDLGYTLGATKHVGSQVGTIESTIGIIYRFGDSIDKCRTQLPVGIHQVLGTGITVIDRDAHDAKQA